MATILGVFNISSLERTFSVVSFALSAIVFGRSKAKNKNSPIIFKTIIAK